MKFKAKIAIIGAGPAGCISAYFASKNADVTLFDFAKPLTTLLYTGGGRCNLAYEEYDFKELAKFYPRGEKFLYSVFSRFSTADTLDFFEKIGVKTYVQDDLRIFPISNSAKDVREKMLNAIQNCEFKQEKVLGIKKDSDSFLIKTDNCVYPFDKVIIAIGGHAGFEIAQNFGHKVISPKPALTGLISEKNFKPLQGISLKDVEAEVPILKIKNLYGDMIFTHEGISGPLVYKLSSLCARLDYSKTNPLLIKLKFVQEESDFQELLNKNSKKDVRNLVAQFVPKAFAEYILTSNDIAIDTKCFEINAKKRELIKKALNDFEIEIVSPSKEGEIVTSGGVCLDEINPKTMQSKLVKGLYFCGEVIDVDGFCGGFNLQNCWSTGFVAGDVAFKD